jgi:hypothetical protein
MEPGAQERVIDAGTGAGIHDVTGLCPGNRQ